MQRIFDVAKSEERKKLQQMGRAQSLLDAEVNRLSELESYRQSYEQRAASIADMLPAHWADYQNFLHRLTRAVAEQQSHVLSGQENRDLHRKNWVVKRKRLDSLKRVVEQYRKTEVERAELKIQKSLDDRPQIKGAFET